MEDYDPYARRYLEENGFLRVEWKGKNVVIRSFHRELGIELTAEMVEDPLLTMERIRRKYEGDDWDGEER